MQITDKFRTDWIDFMSQQITGVHSISLYVPDIYKNGFFQKNRVTTDVNVSVVEKYNRSVKIEYILLGNKFEDIIYLPTSKSIVYIIDNLNGKLNKKINEWLFQNNPTFVKNEYKNYIENIKKGVENLKKERIRSQREKKIKRIDGRI